MHILLAEITGFDRIFWNQKVLSDRDEEFFRNRILPYRTAFRKKWGVNWPCCPDYYFEPAYLDPARVTDHSLPNRIRNSPVTRFENKLPLNLEIAEIVLQSGNPENSRLPLSGKIADFQQGECRVRLTFEVIPELEKKENKIRN